MVKVQATYRGELNCVVSHGPSGDELRTAAPVDNHGTGDAFSPTDLVASALATCTLTIMGIIARRDGIALEGATAQVTKTMSTDAPRRIAALPVVITVPGRLDEGQRKKLEAGARTCPVHKSLHPDIDSPITFVYSKTSA